MFGDGKGEETSHDVQLEESNLFGGTERGRTK